MVCNHEQVYKDVLGQSIETMIVGKQLHLVYFPFSSYQSTYLAEYLS
jgi:hypothetical protein